MSSRLAVAALGLLVLAIAFPSILAAAPDAGSGAADASAPGTAPAAPLAPDAGPPAPTPSPDAGPPVPEPSPGAGPPAPDESGDEDSAGGGTPAPGGVVPPEIVKHVDPVYPESKKELGETATVVVEIDIRADGTVADARIAGVPQPEFDEAALAAARQLLFEPARVDGKAMPVRIQYRFHFVLEEEVVVPERPKPGLRGRLRWLDSGEPVSGAKVAVDAQGIEVYTAADGTFELPDLPPGTHVLRISGEEISPLSVQQDVPPGVDSVDYQVARAVEGEEIHEELLVRPAPKKNLGATNTMSTRKARSVPGVMGDSLVVVQNLPGVGRAAAGSGELVVWGAAPAETRIYVDGMPIPSLYHGGGFRSVLHQGLVQSIALIPGGFGVEYGRATGGIVDLKTAEIDRPGLHGEGAVDLIDSSAAVTYRRDNVATAVAGRFGYVDQVLEAASSDAAQTVPLSSYRDYASKTVWEHGNATASFLFLGSIDDSERRILSFDSSTSPSERESLNFQRAQLSYVREQGDAVSRLSLWAGTDRSVLRADFGDSATFLKRRSLRWGGRAQRSTEVGSDVTVNVGIDLEGEKSRFERSGTVGLPQREGDIGVFGQPPGDQVSSDEWKVLLLAGAGHLDVEWEAIEDELKITPGLRLEPAILSGDEVVPPPPGTIRTGYSEFDLLYGPRVGADYSPTDSLSLIAGAGYFEQPPSTADTSAVFGGTGLEASNAVHLLSGGKLAPLEKTSVELTAYARFGQKITARSQAETPETARLLVSEGESRTLGAQLVLRQDDWHDVSGWISYSISRSQRRDAEDQPWRIFDFDQTHVLVAVASWSPAKSWELGSRVRYSTGYPRTEVVGSYFDSKSNRFEPIFGRRAGTRLPAFAQLDLRAKKTFTLAPYELGVYLDVLNVTNRENAEEIIYNYDYSQSGLLTGLPTFVVIGVEGQF